ncbi:Asp23/Gls24 family envelope stress response protein [Calidifontibacillus oryziterrae]|uniref:Asp23/Gls24 family envelope stress response protein n=1 Tax=Calidifontibacillus oryziterrae TaxID=1191699 RepID=UPI0002F90A0F|nr:Asp23/Gls24 family envelope stress response protein [Calidifontibacillus oryziterrae]
MIKKMLEKGSISISEDVFSIIAAIVIDDMDEIATTVSNIKDDFIRVVNRKGNQKGIIVDNNEEEVSIDVRISVYLGTNICELCKGLQQKISEEIEVMTGIKVANVNVYVDSVKVKEKGIIQNIG